MQDSYLFVPIKLGLVTYRDVFIDRLYSIEDMDLLWQMINQRLVSDAWAAIELDARNNK